MISAGTFSVSRSWWARWWRGPIDQPAALPRHGPDDHQWIQAYRQSDPPVQVVDCACGARARIYASRTGAPEIKIEDAPAIHSPGNALIIDGSTALGDPQGDRIRALISQGG